MTTIDNKKLATELARSIEKSLNDFIEAEVCRRVEAITESNKKWDNFSSWFTEHLDGEIKESICREALLKSDGLCFNNLEQEGYRRALITIKNDVGDWEKWDSY